MPVHPSVFEQRRTRACPDIYRLFDSPDFFFRTATPLLVDAAAVDALIDEWTRVITLDERVAGLWSFSPLDPRSRGIVDFSGLYRLDYRLRGDLPESAWVAGFGHILGYLTSMSDVVRIAIEVYAFDRLGAAMAEAMGFSREGLLGDTITLKGRSWGSIMYARTSETA